MCRACVPTGAMEEKTKKVVEDPIDTRCEQYKYWQCTKSIESEQLFWQKCGLFVLTETEDQIRLFYTRMGAR